MPRLTRTQKYADLREQLSHDAETDLSTPQLTEYENRLNQVQNQAGYFNQTSGYNQYQQQGQPQYQQVSPQYQQPQYTQPVQPQFEQQAYQPQPTFVDPIQTTYVDPFAQKVQETLVVPQEIPPFIEQTPVFTESDPTPIVDIPPFIEPIQATFIDPFTQKVQETPVVPQEIPPFIEPVQPQFEQQASQPQPSFIEPVQTTYVDPFTQKVQETPVVPQETPTFEEFLKTEEINVNEVAKEARLAQEESNDFLAPIDDEKISTIAELESQEPVVQDIPSQEAELLDELDITHTEEPKQEEPAKVEYVNDTFEEANIYNQQNGNDTIDQITNSLVDDIRLQEKNEEPVFEEVEISDEEFSNTVTLEIGKVMEEIASATTQLDVNDILAPTEAEKTPNDFVADYFNNNQEELSKTLNDLPKVEEVSPQEQFTSELQKLVEIEEAKEDIVEIKNISDLEDTHDVISDTMTYIVNNDEDEEDEYYDEDEDDASNTVLNVILIVLIIILVAVLGLIVFYILKTKGILG